MNQVITVSPTGQISGLQRKPGQGFDLKKLGKASIIRATDIKFDENEQRWYITILHGALGGLIVAQNLVSVAQEYFSGPTAPPNKERNRSATQGPLATFLDYDEAVKAEIVVMDYLRLFNPALIMP